jgi:hypothetical protein
MPKYELKTGIGRPIDPEWVREFSAAFDRVMPQGVDLYHQPIPGLVYVTGQDLKNHPERRRRYEWPDRERVAEKDVEKTLGALVLRGELEPKTIKSSVALPVNYAQVRSRNADTQKAYLKVRVGDVANGFYPERFQIAGEKRAIQYQLDTAPTIPPTREIPAHYCNIGTIQGLVTIQQLNEVVALCPSTIEFGPVGIIRGSW